MEKTLTKESLQTRMREAVTELLNENHDIEKLRQHLIQVNRVFIDVSPVRGEATEKAKQDYIMLPTGMSISPEFAAMNLRDVLRTTKYLRSIKNAIDDTLKRLKGEKVHVLYAGCGPYGTLVLPLLTLYKPEQLKVTLLEIQPESLASVRDICNAMGFAKYINGIIQTDASRYKHPADDPVHIITMECMLHTLKREPQVSITRNLCAQMSEDVILIPEEVQVSMYCVDPEIEFNTEISKDEKENARLFIGDIFVLDKKSHELELINPGKNKPPYLQAAEITLPGNLPLLLPLMLFTELKLYKDIKLANYESGITHPLAVGLQDGLRAGDKLSFKYQVDSYPGFYFDKIVKDPWS